ncbi:hypothetical protein A3K63_02250 [Candidatus Micrarchaeota archaeon RBG_16_49_10]|nr:MAG: hypothetical protein A3K63_02250 [Candidatus Micrarchaeota archaeon RBG_16_49_10]
MKKVLVPLLAFIFSFSMAYAAVVPDRIEFYYQMNFDDLRLALEKEGADYEKRGNAIILDYGDFYVSVTQDRLEMNCKEVDTVCMDGRSLQTVLEDLEKYDTFDLSKEEKETIAGLYSANVVIRSYDKKDLMFSKVKSAFLKLLGKLFCTNYERILECNGAWCSLEILKSKECAPEFEY